MLVLKNTDFDLLTSNISNAVSELQSPSKSEIEQTVKKVIANQFGSQDYENFSALLKEKSNEFDECMSQSKINMIKLDYRDALISELLALRHMLITPKCSSQKAFPIRILEMSLEHSKADMTKPANLKSLLALGSIDHYDFPYLTQFLEKYEPSPELLDFCKSKDIFSEGTMIEVDNFFRSASSILIRAYALTINDIWLNIAYFNGHIASESFDEDSLIDVSNKFNELLLTGSESYIRTIANQSK